MGLVIGLFMSYEGYTIPAGWLVMISPMCVHLNPKIFEDPLKFNPWRWSVSNTQSTAALFLSSSLKFEL
jgi:cytochrome P450